MIMPMWNRIGMCALGAVLLLSPVTRAQDQKPSPVKNTEVKGSQMSGEMRAAIAFERAKDRADARQARIEAKHPSMEQDANRVMDDQDHKEDPGRKVKDTKAPGAKRDQ